MNVSACLVTRGDVNMQPVVDSLPPEWERLIWDNSGDLHRFPGNVPWEQAREMGAFTVRHVIDLSVYGRYAAIEYASHDLIYVADDDVIVSDPGAITEWWERWRNAEDAPYGQDFVVANMPQEFRHDGYTDSCLVGFGACFHRDLPAKAFERFHKATESKYGADYGDHQPLSEFRRTCDVVFTTLTPRVLVDVPKTDREMASAPNRMWKQPSHFGERTRMLELARQVRDV